MIMCVGYPKERENDLLLRKMMIKICMCYMKITIISIEFYVFTFYIFSHINFSIWHCLINLI